MTDESRTEESGESRPRWIKEAQEALDRTADAVRTAWDTTRGSRMSALESAKQAAKELGEALERGVEAAKERWEAEDAEEATDFTPETGEADADTSGPPATPRPAPPSQPPPKTPGETTPGDEPGRA